MPRKGRVSAVHRAGSQFLPLAPPASAARARSGPPAGAVQRCPRAFRNCTPGGLRRRSGSFCFSTLTSGPWRLAHAGRSSVLLRTAARYFLVGTTSVSPFPHSETVSCLTICFCKSYSVNKLGAHAWGRRQGTAQQPH